MSENCVADAIVFLWFTNRSQPIRTKVLIEAPIEAWRSAERAAAFSEGRMSNFYIWNPRGIDVCCHPNFDIKVRRSSAVRNAPAYCQKKNGLFYFTAKMSSELITQCSISISFMNQNCHVVKLASLADKLSLISHYQLSLTRHSLSRISEKYISSSHSLLTQISQTGETC